MNNLKNSLVLIAVVLVSVCVLGATSAQAELIDFEGVALEGTQEYVGNNYAEEGFIFYNPGDPREATIVGINHLNTSGSAYYSWYDASDNNPITLTNTLGLTFDFLSLDVGSFLNDGEGPHSSTIFHIIGHLSSGGTVIEQVVQANDFTTLTLEWTDLTHVEFIHVSLDLGAIDNLNLTPVQGSTPVPEPATMLLLGAGLIGLAGFGRKKIIKK